MTTLGRRKRGLCAPLSLMCAAVFCAGAASALDLDLPPGAELVATDPAAPGDHAIATGPFADGQVPTDLAQGVVQGFTWHVPNAATDSSAQLATALAEQLEAQGYRITFACADRACGGFDFRNAISVGEAPTMHVDLGDFRYIAADRDGEDGGRDRVAVVVSRGGQTAYLHLTLVTPADQTAAPVTGSSRAPEASIPTAPMVGDMGLIDRLLIHGSAPLDDLSFQTGASELSGADYASLAELARFLASDPARQIVLVGHTDAQGSLEGNIALSEARAEAVRGHLIDRLGVSPEQVSAAGIGFLAPRAANDTDEGREANRRVEVVLTTPG
ncbi:OmpA family protein [Roseibacterium beibuensis]|uniref:OmpA family protein n=1 Tax=[Roseibacterium] beibuensis TaxID=1193142 RepID=A0ABP9LGJ9_9RHOB|nr:OmpA family protein [Roseibacterium beibuensis]MCS6623034.1 OmpA family protein [Roseibacterium beibuensis]